MGERREVGGRMKLERLRYIYTRIGNSGCEPIRPHIMTVYAPRVSDNNNIYILMLYKCSSTLFYISLIIIIIRSTPLEEEYPF